MQTVGMYAVTALDGVAYGLLLFVVAAGLTLIFGVVDVLNLAHGTLYLAGAYLAHLLVGGTLLGLAAAIAAGAVLGAAGGAALTALVRPLPAGDHLQQGLVTLGVAFLTADLFIVGFGATPLLAEPPTELAGSVSVLGHGYPTYRLLFIAVALVIAAGLHLVVRRTRAGVLLRAVVADPRMAAATGINVARVRTAALAVGGGLAVVAGVLGAPLLGPAPGVGTTVLVLSLIVAVLGRAGSVPATVAAALLIGQVQTVGVIAAPALSTFALFAVVFAVLVVRGRGPAVTRVRAA